MLSYVYKGLECENMMTEQISLDKTPTFSMNTLML